MWRQLLCWPGTACACGTCGTCGTFGTCGTPGAEKRGPWSGELCPTQFSSTLLAKLGLARFWSSQPGLGNFSSVYDLHREMQLSSARLCFGLALLDSAQLCSILAWRGSDRPTATQTSFSHHASTRLGSFLFVSVRTLTQLNSAWLGLPQLNSAQLGSLNSAWLSQL